MVDQEALLQVKRRVEDSLIGLPGVVGVGFGEKEVGGRLTDQLAIRIYVEHKRDVPPEQRLPTSIDGVPTC